MSCPVSSCVFPVNILAPSHPRHLSWLKVTMEATSNPILYSVAAALLTASLLSSAASGVEISPREVYCDIHENHTLCIHQASQSLGKKVPHHGGLNSCNFMNIISWLVGCCKRIETNAGCRQRGVRGGDRAGPERGGEGARRPTAQRAQGLRRQRTGEARRSR